MKAIEINMDKAKDIWRNAWRSARIPMLEELDVSYMKAQEAGDTEGMKDIVDKKQHLRDKPATDLSHIKTIDSLKDIMPAP
jgi:predicted RNA-binding protein with EMAP domain